MLNLFRRNTYLQLLLILIVATLLWITAFLSPHPVSSLHGGPLYFPLSEWISPTPGTILAIVLILLEGFLFNNILYQHKMISQNTLMPMLFYTIAMSFGSAQLTLTPIIIGNLFMLVSIKQLMLTSTLLSPSFDKIFGASACVALATLFCPAMIAFLVPLIIYLIICSVYSFRDWSMVLLGLCAPYILLEAYFFMSDELFYRNYLLLFEFTNCRFILGQGAANWVPAICFILLLAYGIIAIATNTQNRNVNSQRNSTSVTLCTIGGIAYLFYTSFIPLPTQCFAIPFALGATEVFHPTRRREWLMNIVFCLYLLGTMALNFFNL